MQKDQTALKKTIGESWDLYRSAMPEFAETYDALNQEAYADGCIDAKTKRLMALCAALIKGCTACILYQTDYAISLGAIHEEIHETIAVAVSLGGTTAAGEASRVMRFLNE